MSAPAIDTAANRRARKYTRSELARRVLWGACKPLFRLSPRICFGWRAFLLRSLGARIGAHVHIYNSADIFAPWNISVGDWTAVAENVTLYNLGPIHIGAHVTVSRGAHLCAGTHDYKSPGFPLLKPPIVVKDGVWICADAFIGPGVTVGEGAIVAARAVAVRNVPGWAILAGNPARVIKKDRRETDSSSGESKGGA